ncbi:MAG: hypothetical protein COV66_13815 [Nitrospinae bacterium CG11_big_fil_rev_8_21_14_0_20_45_15]|nr:MAG: hypothetical protein COV66_13815 [Nitrospinae bacterium CG11_big_fil_rev_8_21_14_0_20_45_15]
MFFEVKIFDSKGDLKKVVSPQKLSTQFWREDAVSGADYFDTTTPVDSWEDAPDKELKQKGIQMDEFAV